MAGRKKKKDQASVHEELEGLNLEINEWGQVVSSIDISEINRFLDKHTDDKKLRDRENLEGKKVQDTEEE